MSNTTRYAQRALYVVSPILLLCAWELVVRTKLLDARFFPPPSAIAGDFIVFWTSGALYTNTAVTLERIAVGFMIGAVPGIGLGLLVGISPWARAVVDPIVALLYPIPKIAVLPLVLLIFGIGETSKYVLVAFGVFFLVLINTASGVRQIDRIHIDVARSYGFRRSTFYRRVLLPGALPNIIAGVKLSIGIAIVLAVAAEFSASKSGLGYTIWFAWTTLQVERMYVALVVISMLGYLLSLLVNALEFVVLPWRRTS
jgi:NitT/TauT family transport system permease protein